MIQIAICDDNRRELQELRDMLESIMDENCISYHIEEYDSGERLLKNPLRFHLIFLGVVMDRCNGIEIGKQIYRKDPSIKLIYHTKLGEYCKEAINKSHAFAFLDEPLEKLIVEEQIREFIQEHGHSKKILVGFKNVKHLLEGNELEMAMLDIPVDEIIYFEYLKLQKEIKIVTEKGEFIYSASMNKLEERMQPLGFETSCRGILVNLNKIVTIKGYQILLNTGNALPLSQRRVGAFKQRLSDSRKSVHRDKNLYIGIKG